MTRSTELPSCRLGALRTLAGDNEAAPLSVTRFAGAEAGREPRGKAAERPPIICGLDDGAGAGTLDAEGPAGAPATLAGFEAEAGDWMSWRRAIEVFIVFFEGLEALSFTSTRRALRD